MRRHCLIGLLAICLMCGISGLQPALAVDKSPELTRFWGVLRETMANPGSRAVHVAELVAKNRSLTERCLAQQKAKGYGLACAILEEMLILTGPKLDGRDSVVRKMEKAADNQPTHDDKVFYLENMVRLCPGNTSVINKLGDCYYGNRQFGKAVEAYRKSLQVKDDSDTRVLLAKAEHYVVDLKSGKSITTKDVRTMGGMRPMGVVDGLKTRKVIMVNAIQTNQIRFDEWSYAIKKQSEEQLRAVGQAVEEQFRADPNSGLEIEGHTDRRGSEDRNEKLSLERAEAIKAWLVANLSINPSRLRTAGYGFRRPFAATDDPDGWALNRRVEFKKVENVGTNHREARQNAF